MNIQHNLQATCKYLNVCPLSDCSIEIKKGLPVNPPLLLIPGGSKDVHGFYLPVGADGIVTLKPKQEILVACPGDTNGFNNTKLGTNPALATCDSGTTFFVNLDSYQFSDFACKFCPNHTAKPSGNTCYDGTKRNIEVGFEVQTIGFYKLIDVCFDDVLYTTLYVHATIVSGIAGNETGLQRLNFTDDNFFPGMSVDYLYTKRVQDQTISKILGLPPSGNKYINATHYLSRGHLSAKADFVYVSQKNATYTFVNVAPQWQPFNGANWAALESSVQAYADRNKLDLEVYTGTHDVATLPNATGNETDLYLYVDINNNKAIPVPKFYWKAVYEPKSKAGVVFVGINNPHIPVANGDYIFCPDVCSDITWVTWDRKNITKGYSYCCEVDDFRYTVKTLPQFPVSGLLTETENTNDSCSLRMGHYFTPIVLMAGILKFL